jgi:hypothetical protein
MIARHITAKGYVEISVPGHPRARRGGRVFEHILVVEAALGKYLPETAVVHHVDHNKARNVGGNLVVCEDQAYHLLLHRRERALDATGDANNVQCWYCQEWGAPEAFDVVTTRGQFYHKACAARWQQERRDRERGDRPKHLDAVAARPTCKHGHTWTEANTRYNAKGVRWCLNCSRAADARRKNR